MLGLGAQAERAPDALDVDADDPRAVARPPECRDREAREVAHEALRAVAQRRGDLLAQRLEVDIAALAAVGSARLAFADALDDRRGLGGAKKKRSKTSSNTRRSSWDFASVAASASRKSAGSVHAICSSTATASSSSAVPLLTPSARSSAANSTSRAAMPAGGVLAVAIAVEDTSPARRRRTATLATP